MQHRSDIDGLRAVAILPVILFHFGFEFFSGGYVGVDVFFVISGFLITKLIVAEAERDQFSIARFYERRIRRIFPALFTVLLTTIICAVVYFTPQDLIRFSKSLNAATFFYSNIFFSKSTSYFDSSSDMKPLLHTWSLAVEEQFYIFFPLVIVAINKWFKRRWLLWLLPIFLASLALSIWGTKNDLSWTFYSLKSRAWELLLGSLIALGVFSTVKSQKIRDFLGVIGLLMIGWAVVQYSDRTPFPGLAAVLPCFGTGLIILAGQQGDNLVGSLLSTRPLVWIGLISYSLYLWHWPIYVFTKYNAISEISSSTKWIQVTASILISFISWKLVEQPFRERKLLANRKPLFAFAVGIMVSVGTFGLIVSQGKGWPGRWSEDMLTVMNSAKDFSSLRDKCHANERHPMHSLSEKCVLGDGPLEIALWGDSHGVEIAGELADLAKKYNKSFMQITYSACAPFLGKVAGRGEDCSKHNEMVASQLVAHKKISTIYLVVRYHVYLRDEPGRSQFSDGFLKLVKMLSESGKRVILIYPIPQPIGHVPNLLVKARLQSLELETFGRSLNSFFEINKVALEFLDSIPKMNGLEKVGSVHPHTQLCTGGICHYYMNGRALYFDDHHLSTAGARLVMPIFEPYFKQEVARDN